MSDLPLVLVVANSGILRMRLQQLLAQLPLRLHLTEGFSELDRSVHELRPRLLIADLTEKNKDALNWLGPIAQVCPVLVLTDKVYTSIEATQALFQAGVYDVIGKPAGSNLGNEVAQQSLLRKVKQSLTVVTREWQKSIAYRQSSRPLSRMLPFEVVVIASSTGGIEAIEAFLEHVPATIPVPILIAQHMPHNFLSAFADRLMNSTYRRVAIAQPRELILPGTVYFMPAIENTVVAKGVEGEKFGISEQVQVAHNGPSADALMCSVAKVYRKKAIGVVLSGMGEDGTLGLQAIQEAGGLTFAQAPTSCVMPSMPAAAIAKGYVQQAATAAQIGKRIARVLSTSQK